MSCSQQFWLEQKWKSEFVFRVILTGDERDDWQTNICASFALVQKHHPLEFTILCNIVTILLCAKKLYKQKGVVK